MLAPRSILRSPFFCFLLLTAVVFSAAAQTVTYPLTIRDASIENAYVLHAKNWPSKFGLPNPAIIRSNAGERWYQIETSRGNFSPTFGNLFTPETGWVPVAEKNHTQLIYTFNTVPAWATGEPGPGPAKRAPLDIEEKNERCKAPLDGVISPNGDCIWKEWITALMQKNCEVSSAPASPLVGRCHIHYFEAWNEFNAPMFWDDSLDHLAKMANDMAVIVRTYCGDCKIIGGSTSAGGVGRQGDGPSGSGEFDKALGEFLDAWHRIPNASLPDIVSFHAYPSRTNVFPVPMPETNVSEGDPKCARFAVPNVACQYAIVDQPGRVRAVLARRQSFLSASTPVWDTESGWYGNKNLFHGVDANGYADAITGMMRQAFLARETILLANEDVGVNLWYEADHQCDGTLIGFGYPQSSPEMRQCPNDPVIPPGLTPAGRALVVVYGWLHGGTFDGPCKASAGVWSCPITTQRGGRGLIAWTEKLESTATIAPPPGGFRYAHTLDGQTQPLKPEQPLPVEMRPTLFDDAP